MMRSAGIYFIARVLTAALGLAGVAIFTRLATPEIYGVYTLVMTAAVTTFAVGFHWIQSAIQRFLPAEDRARPKVLGAALAGYAIAAALLMITLSAVAAWGPILLEPELWALAGGLVLAYAAMEIALAVIHARQRSKSYALLLLARASGSLVLGSLLLFLGYGAPGLLLGVLVAHAAPVLGLAWHRRHHLRAQRLDPATLRRMAAFGLPIGLVGIAASVIGISDRYMLAALIGLDAAGSYAAPYDLAQRSLQVLLLAAFLATSPMIFRQFDTGDRAALDKSLLEQARLMLLTALPAATIMAVAAPLVARLLFGAAFREAAASLIPIIIAATLVQGIQSYYFSYVFTLAKRTLANAAVVAAGAVLNLLLNLLLIPVMAATGAAVATLASFAAVLGISLFVTRRWMVLPWPARDMLRIAIACLASAPLIGFAARQPDLWLAMTGTALASLLLLFLLLAINAANCRSLLGMELRALLKLIGVRRTVQP